MILGIWLPERKTLDEARLIIRGLRQLVNDLTKRIEQLEEAQNLQSRNSSKPPSQESPKQRAQRKKKQPTGRSHGAQPGHSKRERALLPADQVDWIQRFYPAGHRWMAA